MPESILRRASNSAPEPKPRGANRSTKVAGKLKVLPEQPENLPSLDTKPKAPAAERTQTEGTATTGESEDGDAEEDSQAEEEDVEVCLALAILEASAGLTAMFRTDLQPDIPYSGGHGEKGRAEVDQEEGEVATTSYRVCNRQVRLRWFMLTGPC